MSRVDPKDLAKHIADSMLSFAPRTYSHEKFRLDVEMAVASIRPLFVAETGAVVMDTKALVRQLSETNQLEKLMREACALYGLQLTITDAAKETIEWGFSESDVIGLRVAKRIDTMDADKWYDYNMTLRLTEAGYEVALEGLRETHA